MNPPLLQDSPPPDNKNDDELGYYVLYCEGPGLPFAALHSMKTHSLVRILYDTRLQRTELIGQLALPKRLSLEVLDDRLTDSSIPTGDLLYRHNSIVHLTRKPKFTCLKVNTWILSVKKVSSWLLVWPLKLER